MVEQSKTLDIRSPNNHITTVFNKNQFAHALLT